MTGSRQAVVRASEVTLPAVEVAMTGSRPTLTVVRASEVMVEVVEHRSRPPSVVPTRQWPHLYCSAALAVLDGRQLPQVLPIESARSFPHR